MKEYIVARALEIADYVIETGCTVREAGRRFCVSKSTVHKDLQERLYLIDSDRWRKVNKILGFNLSERHMRGGAATQLKYKGATTFVNRKYR